ncbi:hypothetical protein G6L37_00780 [Agrobacterium rubi]|nr:hypothetical protein [Agrobacterium rubi]NTF23925.1 hypothetical protein [Agrobacterium rubi]
MSDTVIWKLSLPAAAPRSGVIEASGNIQPTPSTEVRLEAENYLSRWLPAADIVGMMDRDIAVLYTETAILTSAATRDRSIWEAFPSSRSATEAQEFADRFRRSVEQERDTAAASRNICEQLGLVWNSPAIANVEAAERSAARYDIASAELSRLQKGVAKWLGLLRPTLRDASFLMAISASLRVADISAMAQQKASRAEVDEAIRHLDEIDRLADELSAEFAFDPSQHSLNAFGGIIRSFSSGRAQDFLAAARKLGIALKGSDQAQKAAALLKKYIAAIGDATGDGMQSDGNRNGAILARARFAKSIRRRADIMAIKMTSLTGPLPDIDLHRFDIYPGDGELATNIDTRALVEENVATAPAGATIADLAHELDRTAKMIAQWAERQRRGLLLSSPNASHIEVEAMLEKNPVPMEASGLVLRNSDDLANLESHIHWLSEAAMLPLSNDQLAFYIAHVSELEP